MNRTTYTNSVTEAQTQKAVCDYLRVKGICFSITNASIHFENGKPRRRVGTTGWADITACLPCSGRLLAIECKSPTGKLRPAQEAIKMQIEMAGGVYVIARSVDDVRKIVEGY